MNLSLPKEKMENIREKCLCPQRNPRTMVLELKKLLGHLTSTMQAILPARQRRYLQQEQIKIIRLRNSCQNTLPLGPKALEELDLRKNIGLSSGRSLIHAPQMTIQTDASKTGWGAISNGMKNRGVWDSTKKLQHIKVLEFKAVHLALLSLLKERI